MRLLIFAVNMCKNILVSTTDYVTLVQETFHIRNTNISTIIFLEFLIDDASAL